MSRVFLVEVCGYLWTTPLDWGETRMLPAGWTHEETSMNMPWLSGGQKASCKMDETKVRGRRRAGVGGGGSSTGGEVAVEPRSRGTAKVEGVHPRRVNTIQLNNENMIPGGPRSSKTRRVAGDEMIKRI